MKSKMTYASYGMAAVILTALCVDGWTPVWGQAAQGTPQSPADTTEESSPSTVSNESTVATIKIKFNPADYGIRNAVKKLQTAKTDAQKDEAKQEMSAALSSYFDADMKDREQDITEIEARIRKLRSQLEKRRQAKDHLVDLQLKVLVNEAEGLGFYGRPTSSSGSRPVRLPRSSPKERPR